MAKLTIRKECLECEVHYSYNGTSLRVVLKNATQEELERLKELGVDVFEKPDVKEDKK